MIARNLISQTVPPLRLSDTGNKALTWMQDFQVRHLPVVDNQRFLGIISEDSILDFNNPEKLIEQHPVDAQNVHIAADDHVYEVLKLVSKYKLSVIPVIEGEQTYLGGITLDTLLSYFSESASITETGSIIVLEISRRNYSLYEIARLIESEGAKVLSSFITSKPNLETLEVTLKLNVQHTDHIIATFERFEYIVKASYQEERYYDTLQERYDALMNYLNV